MCSECGGFSYQDAKIREANTFGHKTTASRGRIYDGQPIIFVLKQFSDDRDPGAFSNIHVARYAAYRTRLSDAHLSYRAFLFGKGFLWTDMKASATAVADIIKDHQAITNKGQRIESAEIHTYVASVAQGIINHRFLNGDQLPKFLGRVEEEIPVGFLDITIYIRCFFGY
jgi:hypothetical protein